jgi:cell division protein FtsQ
VNDLSQENTNAQFDKTVKKHKKKRRKSGVAAFVAAVLLVVAGIYFCYTKLFFVEKADIVVTDYNGTSLVYSEDEVLSGLGIQKGDGLYSFASDEVEERAKYTLPYFEEIEVTRRWPSTVVAKVSLEKPMFYCTIADKTYIVSEELKVLENTTDARDIGINSLIFLKASGIHNCIEGEKLGIDEDTDEIIEDLVETLDENDVLDKITGIDVTNKFDISMMYGSVYHVKLDDALNLDTKIRYLKRIIEDRKDNAGGGVIDLRNVDENEAKFDKFN